MIAIVPRLRQVGMWFLLGLACAAGLAVAFWRFRKRGATSDEAFGAFDQAAKRIELANARAAVEIAAARTKDSMVKDAVKFIVAAPGSDVDKLNSLKALKERIAGRT